MSKIKNIVLVHGFWADASCYNEIIPTLLSEGFEVIAVQNPLLSLADDIGATRRALARFQGNCILVGHSWGGFVISEVGNDERVSGLVYLAALAPNSGESMVDLMSRYGTPAPHFQEQDGFVWISQKGVREILAGDLSAERQALLHATQTPPSVSLPAATIASPAWKNKPCWYVAATDDEAVPLDLQRFLAHRMDATTVEVRSSHFPMISQPEKVLEVIREAAANSL